MADNTKAIAAAARSPLFTYPWANRGHAPPGYTKGLAAAFAEGYRALRAGNPAWITATRPRIGDPAHDVLDYYPDELLAAGVQDNGPPDRLIALFTILIGLGMQESSGRHCCGPDTPEDRGPVGHPVPTTPENAEAGLFQVSYDSVARRAGRQAIVDAYRGRTDLLEVFAEGAHCVKPDDWPADVGNGPPAAFQALTKECPLFAVHYTTYLLRELRQEWGPINRKKVEIKADAVVLFRTVKGLVDAE